MASILTMVGAIAATCPIASDPCDVGTAKRAWAAFPSLTPRLSTPAES